MRNMARMSALMNGLKKNEQEKTDIANKKADREEKSAINKNKLEMSKLKLENDRREGKINEMSYSLIAKNLADIGKNQKTSDTVAENGTNMANDRNNAQGGAIKKEFIGTANQNERENVANTFYKPETTINAGNVIMKTGGTKKADKGPTSVDKALGTIVNRGYTTSGGEERPFMKRVDAERWARSKLGANFETKYPQAKVELDKAWGPKKEDFPKAIKTKKEAYRYLITKYGMTEEDAQAWIEENN